MNWIVSIEPDLTGAENMARDEEMARACLADGVPRLRFYSWSPWALSLGYNQSTDRIDEPEITRRGYDLVRRPTGGRAVFHAEEITYGVAMPTAGRGIHETYALISEALRRGFLRLGAEDVAFSRSAPDFRAHYETLDSEGCFSASALNELTWKGKKVVGSAQRRYDSILLQHGSILLGEAHLDIVDFLTLNPESRPAMRERLRAKTATLDEIANGALPSFELIAAALLDGFVETFAFTPIEIEDQGSRIREERSNILTEAAPRPID